MRALREILYEFINRGNAVKVSAIDPETNTEVSIIGHASVGEATLRRLARRKLDYVLEKRRKESEPAAARRGIVV